MDYKDMRTLVSKHFINNKKTYLLRKKYVNRHLKYLRKEYKNSKGFRRTIYFNRIKRYEEHLYILNMVYYYYKHEHKIKKKRGVS